MGGFVTGVGRDRGRRSIRIGGRQTRPEESASPHVGSVSSVLGDHYIRFPAVADHPGQVHGGHWRRGNLRPYTDVCVRNRGYLGAQHPWGDIPGVPHRRHFISLRFGIPDELHGVRHKLRPGGGRFLGFLRVDAGIACLVGGTLGQKIVIVQGTPL